VKFELNKTLQILERSPKVLENLLDGLDPEWINATEGPQTRSPLDILGHLVHHEKTNWISRVRLILEQRANLPFPPVDRQVARVEGRMHRLRDQLTFFKQLRAANVLAIKQAKLDERRLSLKGLHPELGEVTLRQLLAAWMVHDLNQIAQIARVLAHQYRQETGPWGESIDLLRWRAADT
jgi:hypothetical protein